MKRPFLFILPFMVIALLIWGGDGLDYFLSDAQVRDIESSYFFFFSITNLISITMFFWLLVLASGLPAHRLWKSVIAFHFAIIFPFPFVLQAWAFVCGLAWSTTSSKALHFPIFFLGLVLPPFVFIKCGWYMLRSSLFSSLITTNVVMWRLVLICVGFLAAFFAGWSFVLWDLNL